MPPFQYTPPTNPYVGSIADLMQEPARARARALEQIGTVQARAAQASGQAWAGAVDTGVKALTPNPELEMAQLKLGEAKKQLSDRDKLTQIAKSTPPVQDNGAQVLDLEKITAAYMAAVPGADPKDVTDRYEPYNNIMRDAAGKRQAGLQDLFSKVASSGSDPQETQHALDVAHDNKLISDAEYQLHSTELSQDPAKAKLIVGFYKKPVKVQFAPKGSQPVDEAGNPVGSQIPDLNEQDMLMKAGRYGTANEQPGDKAAYNAAKLQHPDRVPPRPTSEEDKRKYIDIQSKLQLHPESVTPEEKAFVKSYDKEKNIVPNQTFINNEPGKVDERVQRSFTSSDAVIKQMRAPLATQADKIAGLQDLVAQGSPQADAEVAPKLLTVTVGGQGSGIRVTQGEIDRVLGGATVWTNLKRDLNKWSLDPQHAQIPPAQRAQIQKIVSLFATRAQEQLKMIDDASMSLATSQDPLEHRKIVADLRSSFDSYTTKGSSTLSFQGKTYDTSTWTPEQVKAAKEAGYK